MKATGRALSIIVVALTAILIAAGSVHVSRPKPSTPDGAVEALYSGVQNHNWNEAFTYVANAENVNKADFIADLQGRNGSLRSYSALDQVSTSILHASDDEAIVRAALHYYSAVGAIEDTRDLKVVREGSDWKVEWPVVKQPKVPPQVIPVNYLRWDVIYRGAGDDWGAQDAAPPKVRITSMNAIPRDGGTIVLGEIVNDDTVPGFVAVSATLTGNDGEVLGEETAFDKISHTLLPKQVSPFRIDFPGVPLASIKSVRMAPNSMLVPASADPVIAAINQQLNRAGARPELSGQLVNESGQVVNIPHVLATFYDNSGKVVWVSDGYVQHALLPQVPEPFTVDVTAEVAPKVQTYRVTINQYMMKTGN
jgi:hypothetical protein